MYGTVENGNRIYLFFQPQTAAVKRTHFLLLHERGDVLCTLASIQENLSVSEKQLGIPWVFGAF